MTIRASSPLFSKAVGGTKIKVKKFPPPITRAEASYIKREAAYMFAQIRKDKDFQQREWISRFYGMTDEERAGLNEGDIISIESPVPDPRHTPRPRTEAEVRSRSVIERRQEVEKIEKDYDKAKREVEPTDPKSSDSLDSRTPTKPIITPKGSVFPNKSKKDAYPPAQKQPQQFNGRMGYEISNKKGTARIAKHGNIFGLFSEIFKWITFGRRMDAITEYSAERKRLEIKIAGESLHTVPPKPQPIIRLINDLERNGRKTADPNMKVKVQATLGFLNQLLEESYAFWGK